MTSLLSYPGQRCIIEFLEANKRIRLVSRSPALQKPEKSIQFNLNHLQIASTSLTLNDISIVILTGTEEIPEDDARYERRPAEFRMRPGFIRSGHSDSVWHRKFNEVVFFRNRDRIARRPLPEGMKDYIALEKVNQVILGGRKDIRVNMLEFETYDSPVILRLPEDLNFRIRGLSTNREHFKYYLPLIDSSSFPLKKLQIPFHASQMFEHPIVQHADCLTITLFTLINATISLNDIRKLTNKTVVIRQSTMRIEDITTLIRDWLSGEKAIGTTLMLEKHFVPINQEIFTSIKENFEEFVIEEDFENVEENFLPNFPRFCIPINDSSNLLVYAVDRGIDNIFNRPASAFVMKVVTTIPEVAPDNCQFEDGVPLVLPCMIFVLFAYSYFCAPSPY